MDLVDAHGLLLSVVSVVAPRRTSVAGVVGDEVDERHTPPTVGCRTRETEGGEEDAARPRACPVLDTGVIRGGTGSWGLLSRGALGPRDGHPVTGQRMGERRSSAQGEYVTGGKLRDVKRPACLERQTGACRSCGLAVSQPCRRREEPVETTDAFRPTGGGRGAESGPSLMPNGRSDQPQPPDGCPVTEAINFNHRTGVQRAKGLSLQPPDLDRGRRTSVNSVVSARAGCEGPTSTPHCQHSLVGDRGRANHPPIGPVQQGSRTQVSMVGNLGKSQTARSLSTARDPQKRACNTPFANRRQIVH